MTSAFATMAANGRSARAHGSRSGRPRRRRRAPRRPARLDRQRGSVRRGRATRSTACSKASIDHGTGTARRPRPAGGGQDRDVQEYTNAWFCGFVPQLDDVRVGRQSGRRSVPMRERGRAYRASPEAPSGTDLARLHDGGDRQLACGGIPARQLRDLRGPAALPSTSPVPAPSAVPGATSPQPEPEPSPSPEPSTEPKPSPGPSASPIPTPSPSPATADVSDGVAALSVSRSRNPLGRLVLGLVRGLFDRRRRCRLCRGSLLDVQAIGIGHLEWGSGTSCPHVYVSTWRLSGSWNRSSPSKSMSARVPFPQTGQRPSARRGLMRSC